MNRLVRQSDELVLRWDELPFAVSSSAHWRPPAIWRGPYASSIQKIRKPIIPIQGLRDGLPSKR